jgi:hypothetical protein
MPKLKVKSRLTCSSQFAQSGAPKSHSIAGKENGNQASSPERESATPWWDIFLTLI